MKRNKLITRVFALLASLLLVFALALPCFADVAASNQMVLKEYTVTTFAEFKEIYAQYWEAIVFVSYTIPDSNVFNFTDLQCTSNALYATATYVASTSRFTTVTFTYDGLSSSLKSTNVICTIDQYGGLTSNSTSVIDVTASTDTLPYPVTLTVLEELAAEDSGNEDAPSAPATDMYSDLYYVLKDAIYGADVELTGSQEYALTLISTILTYATVLLPVLLVVGIAVWCFKRF